ARVSSGGSWTASTVFRSGESYADVTFSVQTVITRTAGQVSLGDLETWTATKDGAPVTATDRNFWGVTFIGDGPGFYATMGTGAGTVLYAVGKGIRTGVDFDVWSAPVDGTAPHLLVRDAASPSVVVPGP